MESYQYVFNPTGSCDPVCLLYRNIIMVVIPIPSILTLNEN